MGSFYASVDNNSYMNVFYALNITLELYLAKILLNNDLSRIVYSSTDYALIKRSGQQEWNNAALPFVNYKMTTKEFGGARNWFSMEAFSQGIYISELRKKLRISPITISYDMSFWSSRDDDYQYALDKLLIESSSETKLEFTMDYNGIEVGNIAIITFDLDSSNRFTESDYLERNNIWSFGINPSIQTFLPAANASGFCIPKKLLIEYAVYSGELNNPEDLEYEKLYEYTINHLNQTVTIE